jgi:hypothetical protein
MQPDTGGLEGKPMTQAPHQLVHPSSSDDGTPAQALARRLAAAGLGVEISRRGDICELTILGAASGKSFVTLNTSGQARWYYEPAAGPGSSPATLSGIIAYLLGAPHGTASLTAYRALPLKGQVGRSLQDRGLAVTLRVSEDLESFEATTDIDVTSPARPWLGAVRLSDDAALDWHLNWWAAFRWDPAALIDVITPVLRHR